MKKKIFVIILFCIAILAICLALKNYLATTGNINYLFTALFSIPVFLAIACLLYREKNRKDDPG